jgi:hypothetical protein
MSWKGQPAATLPYKTGTPYQRAADKNFARHNGPCEPLVPETAFADFDYEHMLRYPPTAQAAIDMLCDTDCRMHQNGDAVVYASGRLQAEWCSMRRPTRYIDHHMS